MKLHLYAALLPAASALITAPRHRAITRLGAAQIDADPPSLEAASFDALGGNIVLKALRRRCVGRRAQKRYFVAYNATRPADYAETLAALLARCCRPMRRRILLPGMVDLRRLLLRLVV